MSPGPLRTLDTEALLEHAGWMRKLALSLVGDAQRADDLAQDTWVRALEHRPRTDLPLRGWLATVMRNVLRQERRGAARRELRERRVASDAETRVQESGLAVLARVTMQRELVESVLALEEPYRTTVLLRYFEELTPRRIAERHGVPVSTVKTRLARGLERLRRRLDDERGGDGKAWVVALLPVLEKPAGLGPALPLAPLSLGALALNTKIAVVALTLTAIGAGYLLTRSRSDEQPLAPALVAAKEDPAALERPASGVSAGSPPAVPATAAARRSVSAAPTPERAAEAAVEPAGVVVQGRVVDVEGRPVAGLELVARETRTSERSSKVAPALGTSGPDGTFTLRTERGTGLVVRDPGYTTVMMAASVDRAMDKEPIVVVAPRIHVAGLVIDADGVPVGGARVEVAPPESMRADLGWVLDFSHELPFAAVSGPDGRFELDEAPGYRDGVLRARADGARKAEQPSPAVTDLDVLVVLGRPERGAEHLSGIVLDALGAPVPQARVSLGLDTTRTDETGAFAFDLSDPDAFNRTMAEYVSVRADELLALKEGHLPGRLRAEGVDAGGRPRWPDPLVLRLGAAPLEIAGRVVDERGEPLSGMRVWLEDPTFFGGEREEGRRWPRMTHVESVLGGLDDGWPYVESDSAGRFRLTGLMERDYALAAMDPATLVRTTRAGVRAGETGVELVLSREDLWETIRGRVVDGRGRPVSGASVAVSCDAFRTRVQGQVVGTRHASGASAVTDDQGRFEVRDVPMETAYFRVDHPDTIPVEVGRSEQALRGLVGEDPEDFTLVVSRRCHFQLELDDPSQADEFEIHDLRGTPLPLSEFQGNGRRDGTRFALEGGRTNVLAVGDTAATLVLFAEGQETRRVPIELRPGERPILRP